MTTFVDSGLISLVSYDPGTGLISPGSVLNVGSNTLQSLDPNLDATQNANYGGANLVPAYVAGFASWCYSATGWGRCTDYSGLVYCSGYGAEGSLMNYGSAGHAAGGPCIWARYDIATATWSLIGKALQTDSLTQVFLPGTNTFSGIPPATRWNSDWGDWIGASTDWPVAWRQPGFNPPEGAHTRAGLVYRPASAAGNSQGEIWATCFSSGVTGGLPLGASMGCFVFDLDTGLWSRATKRAYGTPFEAQYDAVHDKIVCCVWEFSHWMDFVDVLDCATRVWTRRYITDPTRPYVQFDSSQFIYQNWFVVCVIESISNPNPPMKLYAVDLNLIAGSASIPNVWPLNISAPSGYPVTLNIPSGVNGPINSQTNAWMYNSDDGCFYCINKGGDPHRFWKMTPPADPITGTWVITPQTLTGDALVVSSTDYATMHYIPSKKAFAYQSNNTSARMALVRSL
jgi:hypothetical protein